MPARDRYHKQVRQALVAGRGDQTMDSIALYRQQIEHILTEYARIPYVHGNIQIQTVFDRDADRYLLMLVGRDGIRRVHGCLVHVDIVDGKIYIQRDGTEYGIARELLDVGVPPTQIVLAFRASSAEPTPDTAAA